jgi:hypothetical protein
VSPILGIWASQNYVRVTNSYESIATTTVGAGGTSTVTFSSIPSTYKHLQIRAIARTSATGGTTQNFNMTINNDTSTAYSFHQLLGDGTSASSYGENVNRSNCVQILHIPTNSSASNIFGAGIIDILDYTNTNKNRTVKSLRGQDQNNSDGGIALHSYLYTGTTAINRLDFFAGSGNLVQYSQIALYGIKG